MKKIGFLLAGALVLALTACHSESKGNETKTEIVTDEEITDVEPDDKKEEPEIKAETVVTEDNMEYYTYYSGSTSVCERGAVYHYKGEFILIADYFNCGDEYMETYPLSEEELRLFLEEINAAVAKAAEKEKKEEKEEKEDEAGEGGSSTRAGVSAGGIYYPIWEINLEALGISMTDAYGAAYPSKEEGEHYKIEGFLDLQEKTQWNEGPVSVGSAEFQRSVGKQIEEWAREEIGQMTIEDFQEEDFEIIAETENGEKYRATVTYAGYVAKVEQE